MNLQDSIFRDNSQPLISKVLVSEVFRFYCLSSKKDEKNLGRHPLSVQGGIREILPFLPRGNTVPLAERQKVFFFGFKIITCVG